MNITSISREIGWRRVGLGDVDGGQRRRGIGCGHAYGEDSAAALGLQPLDGLTSSGNKPK